jgi:hypothetical protein
LFLCAFDELSILNGCFFLGCSIFLAIFLAHLPSINLSLCGWNRFLAEKSRWMDGLLGLGDYRGDFSILCCANARSGVVVWQNIIRIFGIIGVGSAAASGET